MHDHQFAIGMKVYDTVGYTVGKLDAYNAPGGYLAVRTGWLGRGKVRFIPVDAVDHGGATGGVSLPRFGAQRDISLLLSRDDLKAERYNAPPTGGTLGLGGAGQSATSTTQAQDHA